MESAHQLWCLAKNNQHFRKKAMDLKTLLAQWAGNYPQSHNIVSSICKMESWIPSLNIHWPTNTSPRIDQQPKSMEDQMVIFKLYFSFFSNFILFIETTKTGCSSIKIMLPCNPTIIPSKYIQYRRVYLYR